MRNAKELLISSLIMLCFAVSIVSGFEMAAELEKLGLRILYAGHPGSEREKDFVQFLQEHFVSVKTGDLAKFGGRQADGVDVSILDYDGDGFKAPRPPVSPGYTGATVTVGVVGAFICEQVAPKAGYL